MALIKLPNPKPKPNMSDIELFAKAYFNMELTREQLEIIDSISKGRFMVRGARKMGLTTVNQIVRAYLSEGLKKNGRMRLPKTPIPRIDNKKLKHMSQHSKILALTKRPGGAYNFELSRFALKYTSVISDLRKDGHNIIAERQYLKNGRASNTWRYIWVGQE